MKQLPERIPRENTGEEPLSVGMRTLLGTSVRVTLNLNISVDRAGRVTPGTTMEHLEHVVRRIRGENTN